MSCGGGAGTIPESFASMSALEMLAFDLNVGMCSNTTAPHPPEHIGILPGTIYPNTCPVSKVCTPQLKDVHSGACEWL